MKTKYIKQNEEKYIYKNVKQKPQCNFQREIKLSSSLPVNEICIFIFEKLFYSLYEIDIVDDIADWCSDIFKCDK